MRELFHKIYEKIAIFYVIFLCLVSGLIIIYLMPKGLVFKYEFQKNKTWAYESLYAPFEFTIKKSSEQIQQERQEIEKNAPIYYHRDSIVFKKVLEKFNQKKNGHFPKDIPSETATKIAEKGIDFLHWIYKKGVIPTEKELPFELLFIENQKVSYLDIRDLVAIDAIYSQVDIYFSEPIFSPFKNNYYKIFSEILIPNIVINKNFTEKAVKQNLEDIVYSTGFIKKDELIITKGEVVSEEKLAILYSLKQEYENEKTLTWKELLSVFILIEFILVIIVLYINKFYKEITNNEAIISLIFTNILGIIALICIVSKYNPYYIYAVPVCLLPLLFRAFFDIRLGLFIQMMTILLIGLIIPNSFQFIFITSFVSCVLMLNHRELHYRVVSYLMAGSAFFAYIISYILYGLFSEVNSQLISVELVLLFALNCFSLLLVQPLIYAFEKIFGLISNLLLLELSDTNAPLLQKLSEKAVGTFHHSLQVANLSEAAAKEIGANAMLVRVGALYHDIGKINNPQYFTENQKTSVSPHDELSPIESAQIIIKHVIDGIEIARENNLPEQIIDFIRTHHGSSLVYYFYKKQLDSQQPLNESDFHYPGPLPFSKETAILMIADSVEAASKSLKNPTTDSIEKLVENIIKKQFEEKQFLNADITLKEIEKIKKVLIIKLIHIFRLRIEYPE